ncbi:MAG: M20/M25/M40 family metallo-hydrolase [Gemmatimonadota bacterium]
MTRLTAFVLGLGILAACAPPASSQASDAELRRAAATITPNDFYARIGFLASDALQGRDTPSQGLEVAAAYIVSEFRSMGLEPAGENGTYFQRYPFVIRELATAATVFEATAPRARSLTYGADFYAGPATAAPIRADLVYYHPGEGAADARVRGKVVLVTDPLAAGRSRADERAFRPVRSALLEAGAAALVVALPDDMGPADVAARAAASTSTRSTAAALPTFFVRAEPLRELVRAAGGDLQALAARAPGAGPTPLGAVHLAAPYVDVDHQPPNVAAMLPGSDPALRDTYVIFSAHMDHVGIGNPDESGDSIYNGADDDASGTSAILEMAEAFAALPTPPRRSVIFMAVSGEEKGLLGSRYYADHPTLPLGQIVANVNMDMIGRNDPDSVVAIGQDLSSLGPLVQEVATRYADDLRLTVAEDIWPDERFFFRSDHFSFAAKEIPALFFFTGVHEDYHRASDHVEKIDTDKAARIAKLAFYFAHAIAADTERPAYTAEGLRQVREAAGGRN